MLEKSDDLELVSLGNQERGRFDTGPGRYEGRPVLWARLLPISASCHYPHHLLRTIHNNAEVSVCFQCANFYAHRDGKLVVGGCLSGTKDFYDGIFQKYGVKLPPTEDFGKD